MTVGPQRGETPWARLPSGLADGLRGELPETAQTLAEAAVATPRFAAITDPKFVRDVDTAVRVALERFVDLVGTSEPALPPQVREVFVGLGGAEAREDRGPEALLSALRVSARALFRVAAAVMESAGLATTDHLVDLSDAIQAFVDELAAAATDGFALQVRERAGEGDRLRRHLAELLIRGTASPELVDDAAAAVGWRPLGKVVPVLLGSEHARHARFRFSPDGLVVERERDVLLLLRDGPSASRSALMQSLPGRSAIVGPALDSRSVPVAIALAEHAAVLLAAHQPTDGAPLFADDHLAVLALRGETEALAILAARRLAPLSDVRAPQRVRLLETLESWLRHWGSRADIAAELFVHPQTVSYRMRRLRDLFGADLDDPIARFELQLVLRAGMGAPSA